MAEYTNQFYYVWRLIPELFKAINKIIQKGLKAQEDCIMDVPRRQCSPDLYEDCDPDADELGEWNLEWGYARKLHLQRVTGKLRMVYIQPTTASSIQQAQAHTQECKQGESSLTSESSETAQVPRQFILVPSSQVDLIDFNLRAGTSAWDVNHSKFLGLIGGEWNLYDAAIQLEPGNEERGEYRSAEVLGVLEDLDLGVVLTFLHKSESHEETAKRHKEEEGTAWGAPEVIEFYREPVSDGANLGKSFGEEDEPGRHQGMIDVLGEEAMRKAKKESRKVHITDERVNKWLSSPSGTEVISQETLSALRQIR
ncbi:hypothetical protein BDZ45DRAFT_793959 [Acephala macrosclerotiorum]|nr:hypothetical protein BDZ45DRAFT_793959 [Acephala macrosclerotiorum]